MDRSAAIETLRSEGFHAFERTWSYGDSIGVAALPQQHGTVIGYGLMMYLYPINDGHWNITNLNEPRSPDKDCRLPLAEAVALVIQSMRSAEDALR